MKNILYKSYINNKNHFYYEIIKYSNPILTRSNIKNTQILFLFRTSSDDGHHD